MSASYTKLKRKKAIYGYAFIAPMMIGFLLFMAVRSSRQAGTA
jgi:hypothetical protein